MKNWIILTVFAFLTLSAKAERYEVKVEHFTQIKVMGHYSVILKKGDKEKVEVINDEADLDNDKIIFKVKDRELSVKLKGDTYKERMLEIIITYTDLDKIISKMGCEVKVEDVLKGDRIELECEAGGKIKATMGCEFFMASINTGGSIHIDGVAEEATYKVGAGGTIAAVRVKVDKVSATVTAGGEIICAVKDQIDIKITSGGNVSYMGDPLGYSEKITLGGKITKMKNSNVSE